MSAITEETFVSEESARLAGISYRKLAHWCALALYRRVVERVLAGATEIRFQLTDHVTLTVDVGDLRGGGAG